MICRGHLLSLLHSLSHTRTSTIVQSWCTAPRYNFPLLHAFTNDMQDPKFSLLARVQFFTQSATTADHSSLDFDYRLVLSMFTRSNSPIRWSILPTPTNLLMSALFIKTLDNWTSVSGLSALTITLILTGPRGHILTVPIRPGSLYTNRSLSLAHVLISLSMPICAGAFSHRVACRQRGGQGMSPNREIKWCGNQSFNNAIVSLAVCAGAPSFWNHVLWTFCLSSSGIRNSRIIERYLSPVTL